MNPSHWCCGGLLPAPNSTIPLSGLRKGTLRLQRQKANRQLRHRVHILRIRRTVGVDREGSRHQVTGLREAIDELQDVLRDNRAALELLVKGLRAVYG